MDLIAPGLSMDPTRWRWFPAFSKYVQSGIVLQVGQNVQINIALTVGSVSQEVHVSANAAMVETQETSISQVIDQKRIIDLPLNGRQATDLIVLSGGAAIPPNCAGRDVTSHDYVNSLAVSVSGGQINGNNFFWTEPTTMTLTPTSTCRFPSRMRLQEFSVQTSGIAARFGLHPGSVVNAATKSGTNSFHGNLFEFSAMATSTPAIFSPPRRTISIATNTEAPLAGPSGEIKSLFSADIRRRESDGSPEPVAFVATQAALNGDFSTLESAGCQSNKKAKQLMNPSTGQPFAKQFHQPQPFHRPFVERYEAHSHFHRSLREITYPFRIPATNIST